MHKNGEAHDEVMGPPPMAPLALRVAVVKTLLLLLVTRVQLYDGQRHCTALLIGKKVRVSLYIIAWHSRTTMIINDQ